MLAKCLALALFGLAIAAPEEEKQTRQVILPNVIPNGCTNTFQLSGNPCQGNLGRVNFPVPGDQTKFVQCDELGRAYVVQCPAGLVYNQATTSCQSQGYPQGQILPGPCTSYALASGQICFSYPGDNTKFYQCRGVGTAQVLRCPGGLVWDAGRVACVYSGSIIVDPILTPSEAQQFVNPCTPKALAGNHYYFPHPDPTKFIQCDNAGQAFPVSCPSGLVWNQYSETCGSAYANTIFGRKRAETL